jgi:hypothetical protein
MIQRSWPRNAVALSAALLAVSTAPLHAADVTGHWQVIIKTPDGTVTGVAAFKQAGQAVTGWLGPSEEDPIPITVILKGNKLIITTHPQPGRTVAFAKCEVTIRADRMAGTIDTDRGTIEFVRSAPVPSQR